ncbi:hypothetical protein CTS44_00858 [Comamonas thiooxydans]|nr:hypothetical protein CTS44_00858 [Comamonas thiooxydans]
MSVLYWIAPLLAYQMERKMNSIDKSRNSPIQPRFEVVAAKPGGPARLRDLLEDPGASAEAKQAAWQALKNLQRRK